MLLVNHSDTLGEAASTTFRLMQAMRRAGIDARMLVYTKRSAEPNVACVGGRLPRGIRYCMERIDILWHSGFNKENIFSVSTGRFAMNIRHHPWAREADIICLHWINQGLLNLNGIQQLHLMGKKIVWTLHDMWPFTGVCHNSQVCEYYTDRCGNCMFLRGGGHPDDLSRIFWDKKLELYDRVPITFVAESKHLELKARSSTLLRNRPVMTIHNPIHIDFFYTTPVRHLDSMLTTTKPYLILVGASNLDRADKGLDYAIEALNHIFDNFPDIASKAAVYLFGDMADPGKLDNLRMSGRWLGRINDYKILRYLYASAKVILSPATMENTPLTLIEGMAGGATPVAFHAPGHDELINHKSNGYLAEYKNSRDLAAGIMWALEADVPRQLQHDTVRSIYAPEVVVGKYIDLFTGMLK